MQSRRGVADSVFSDYLYEAADLTLEIVRRIRALEKMMVAIGGRESPGHHSFLELKSDAVSLCNKICRLADYATKRKILETQGKIGGRRMEETGGESPGRSGSQSLDRKELIIGKPGDEFREDNIHRLLSGIMLKFEQEAGNSASVFEEEKSRKEAEAALSFVLKVDIISQEIDELRREMRGLIRSFLPENRDVRNTLIMFTREPYLHRIAKLQWISNRIYMLQRVGTDLDSNVRSRMTDLDSNVRSRMTELKSESFFSALKEEERSGGQGVAAENAGKSSVEMDEKRFAFYRLCWERTWGNGYSFENQTLLSSMQFTHCTPGRMPADAIAGSTLQIYSIRVLGEELDWPLEVFGVVAARDDADRHRNPLFCRTRDRCQVLTQEDPFLRLTGPLRSVVVMDNVYIEAQLKRKGATAFEDTALVSTFMSYDGKSFSTCADDNRSCTIELCSEQLEQSVQATVLSVLIETTKSGSLPFPNGGKIVCSPLPCNSNGDYAGLPSTEVLLFDSEDGDLSRARDGNLELLRNVVSVELRGRLKFQIYSYSDPAEMGAHVIFTPKKSKISKGTCYLDGSKVEITLAWSLLPSTKMLS